MFNNSAFHFCYLLLDHDGRDKLQRGGSERVTMFRFRSQKQPFWVEKCLNSVTELDSPQFAMKLLRKCLDLSAQNWKRCLSILYTRSSDCRQRIANYSAKQTPNSNDSKVGSSSCKLVNRGQALRPMFWRPNLYNPCIL